MRELSAGLAEHIAGTATTLCRCWLVTRRDSVAIGFTDHDRDLFFGGHTFIASPGLDATQAENALGLAVGGAEVSGALTSASLNESDLANGVYDGASVETWIVNWSDVSQRHLLDAGTIGEVSRTENTFTTELRTIAHEFDQVRGRLFQAACAASLGDAECGVSLAAAELTVTASAAVAGTRHDLRADLGDLESGWFTGGTLTFTSGPNSGAQALIKGHTMRSGHHSLTFWVPLAQSVELGDTFRLTAGCDKSFSACRSKFSNQANFRGFPHMPGNDMVASYPSRSDQQMDGGSLFQ